MKPIPYPANTRAKGWRFELDHERIRQSDTWALASPEVRPWLLMLWMTAWEQTPCGSLPAEDELIAARIGMPAKTFAKHRAVLLRGWWQAEDGRLYHDTLVSRALEMLDKRRGNAQRVAQWKAAKREQHAGNALPTDEQQVGNDTRTRTSTGTSKEDSGAKAPASSAGTPAGAVCRALKAAGIANVNPGNLRLTTLLAAGATEAEFLAHAEKAKGMDNPFAYLLATVEGERKRAAATAGQLHQGRLPNKQEALEERNRAVGLAWLAKQEGA